MLYFKNEAILFRFWKRESKPFIEEMKLNLLEKWEFLKPLEWGKFFLG